MTVFKVLPNGQKTTLRDDFFGRVCGILVSDRATALKFWAMHRRQVCWVCNDNYSCRSPSST